MKAIDYNTAKQIETLLDLVDEALRISRSGEGLLSDALDNLRTHRERIELEDTDKRGRRTTDFCAFGHIVADHLAKHHPGRSIYRISAPERRGDVEVVFRASGDQPMQAVTYRADGTWSGLSYWCEGQI